MGTPLTIVAGSTWPRLLSAHVEVARPGGHRCRRRLRRGGRVCSRMGCRPLRGGRGRIRERAVVPATSRCDPRADVSGPRDRGDRGSPLDGSAACKSTATVLGHSWPRGLLVVALVGGIGLSAHAYNLHHEKEYLARLSGVASQRVLLRDGQACDWLTSRRWGGPPVRQADLLRHDSPYYSAPFDPIDPGRNSNSTARLWGYYVTYLDRQRPGPLVAREVVKARIAMVACFRPVSVPARDSQGRRRVTESHRPGDHELEALSGRPDSSVIRTV
jgi:hypothetical protein